MGRGFESYHTDLIHGLDPNKHLGLSRLGGATGAILAGKGNKPTAIVKPALSTLNAKSIGIGLHPDMINAFSNDEKLQNKAFHILSDFNTSLREGAYDKVGRGFFGLGDYIPKTTVFTHPHKGTDYSAMEYIENAKPAFQCVKHWNELARSGEIHKLAIMNSVLGNHDRHATNYIFDSKNKLKLIDNGMAFDYHGSFRHPIPHYAEADHESLKSIPAHVSTWLNGLSSAQLDKHMADANVPELFRKAAVRRLEAAKERSKDGIGLAELLQGLHKIRIEKPPEKS
jgi:hypothetical protein